MNLVMLPMWILSGTFFSYSRFPDAMIPFVKALPLTALNDALRAVMIDGAAVTALGTPIAIVVAWGAVSFVVALRIFRWREPHPPPPPPPQGGGGRLVVAPSELVARGRSAE